MCDVQEEREPPQAVASQMKGIPPRSAIPEDH